MDEEATRIRSMSTPRKGAHDRRSPRQIEREARRAQRASEGPAQQPAGPAPGAYRELFERSADAILIIDGDTFIDCNEATVRMLRYRDKADLLRTHPSELSPDRQPDGRDSYEKANEMIAIAFERGSHRFEWEHRRADGEVFPVEVLLTAIQEPDRRVLHVVWRDITDRKQLEAELRHAQKMEAVGKLAGGIAHDFNNLVAILGNSDLLREMLSDNPRALRHVDEIQSAGDRAAGFVRQLLTFSRRQEVVPRVVDVNRLIRGIQPLLLRLLGEDVRLSTELTDLPLRVVADAGQIEQVLLNLASNAGDAMPEGGVLTLESRLVEVGDSVVGGVEALGPGRYVEIAVRDTGVGMASGTVERAFDPFFTTKAVGKGTGLGLATVYGIVQRAGGSVTIESTLGHGTRVEVLLPLTSADAREAPRSRHGLPEEGGNETVLLAEDDAGVSMLVAHALRRVGYTVFPVATGREALELYSVRHAQVDLIVSDVIMPDLGGAELVSALRDRGFSPRILFLSGYTDNALARLQGVEGGIDLLEKPFRTHDLIGRVRLALDRPRDPAGVPPSSRPRG